MDVISSANNNKKKDYSGAGWAVGLATYFFTWFLRPIFKWLLHILTGRSELERIAYGSLNGAAKVNAISRSLMNSRCCELRELPNCALEALDSAVQLVIKTKHLPIHERIKFQAFFRPALAQLIGFNQLMRDVEMTRKIQYDSTCLEHEHLLTKLWSLLKPDENLRARHSKQWQDIGFQGDDPATDFRGMGILALKQLIYFCEKYSAMAQRIYSRSLHPVSGYPFAVASISLTSLTRELLLAGSLRTHFSNLLTDPPQINDFHECFCLVFTQFDNVWHAAKPTSVMQFNHVRQQLFIELMKFLSSNENAVLHCAQLCQDVYV